MVQRPPYSELSKGSFLIASPDIDQGVFFRSVILICEHTSNGSFGLIINKPVQIDLPPELIELKNQGDGRAGLRAGGPIQPQQMMLLHSAEEMKNHTMKICDGVFLGGDLQFLQAAMNSPSGPELLLCFGYTGWNAGQLEREFLSGNWFLAPASNEMVFHTPPEKIWQAVLRQMGGKYTTLSMIPEDLSLN